MPSEDFPRFSAQELQALLAPTYEALTSWALEGEAHDTPAHPRPSASPWELTISENGCSRQEIDVEIQQALRRSVNPWTGCFWEKLYSRPDPVGVVGDMVVAASYASGHVESANPFFAKVEAFCVKQLGQLFGFDESLCDGVTMPGGSASNTLALQACLTWRFARFRRGGLAGIYADLMSTQTPNTVKDLLPKVLIFASEHCHYSIDQSAVACGLGTESVVKVGCDKYGRMSPQLLETAVRDAIDQGHCPLFVCATAGTTVLGAFDDVSAIASVCQRFLLFRTGALAGGLQIEAPYLFHAARAGDCEREKGATLDQATKTLGCGRRPDAFKFYLAWKRHGSHGFGRRITQALQQAQDLRQYLRDNATTLQLELGPIPSPPFLQVLFRPICSATTHQERSSNACIRAIHRSLCDTRFAVDFAPVANTADLYMRLVVHPYTKWKDLLALVQHVSEQGARFYGSQAGQAGAIETC